MTFWYVGPRTRQPIVSIIEIAESLFTARNRLRMDGTSCAPFEESLNGGMRCIHTFSLETKAARLCNSFMTNIRWLCLGCLAHPWIAARRR